MTTQKRTTLVKLLCLTQSILLLVAIGLNTLGLLNNTDLMTRTTMAVALMTLIYSIFKLWQMNISQGIYWLTIFYGFSFYKLQSSYVLTEVLIAFFIPTVICAYGVIRRAI